METVILFLLPITVKINNLSLKFKIVLFLILLEKVKVLEQSNNHPKTMKLFKKLVKESV